nr:hypothetical protein [Clostridium estertheticum]
MASQTNLLALNAAIEAAI